MLCKLIKQMTFCTTFSEGKATTGADKDMLNELWFGELSILYVISVISKTSILLQYILEGDLTHTSKVEKPCEANAQGALGGSSS